MVKKISRWMVSIAAGILCAGLFSSALVPAAKADAWNQRTVVTLNQPLRVPGKVLQPGTYVFRLLNSNAERKVVQVFNPSENHLIATFIGVPTYRDSPAAHTVLQFKEAPANTPESLHAWFYPGDNYGLKFNYSR